MRTPPLNTLRLFDAAARHLNFRRAAQELNLTQGAVAQQVRRLEKELGVQLFHRQARGLSLTEAGRRYSGPVRRALAIVEDATRQLQPDKARITLSVPPSLASKWLVPRLKFFMQTHPTIEVQTVASEKLADFRSDSVDLAIRQGHPPFGNGLEATLLAPLDLCAVCSPEHAAGLAPIKQLSDFLGLDLIHDGHGHWDSVLAKAGLNTPGRQHKFSHSALAIDAAASGQGIALVPRLLVAADLQQGRLTEIWSQQQTNGEGYYIVRPATQAQTPTQTPEIHEMIDWLLTEAAGPESLNSPRPDCTSC